LKNYKVIKEMFKLAWYATLLLAINVKVRKEYVCNKPAQNS